MYISTGNTRVSPGTKLKIGYRQKGSALAFTYLDTQPSAENLPYTFVLPDGAYEIEYTALCPTCNVDKYSQTVRMMVDINAHPTTTTTTTYPTTTTTTTPLPTTSTTTTHTTTATTTTTTTHPLTTTTTTVPLTTTTTTIPVTTTTTTLPLTTTTTTVPVTTTTTSTLTTTTTTLPLTTTTTTGALTTTTTTSGVTTSSTTTVTTTGALTTTTTSLTTTTTTLPLTTTTTTLPLTTTTTTLPLTTTTTTLPVTTTTTTSVTTTITTTVGVAGKMVIGTLVAPGTSATTVANKYGATALRSGFVLGGNSNLYKTYSDAGYEVVVTLNTAGGSAGTSLPVCSALDTYGTNIDAFLSAADSYNCKVISIQNEENNQGYWNNPDPHAYLDMLDIAIPKVHAHGKKVTNGGLPGDPLCWMVWKDLYDNTSKTAANAFANKVFDSGVISALLTWDTMTNDRANSINFMKVVIPAYAIRDLDYVNFHWYEPSHNQIMSNEDIDPTAITTIISYLNRVTGKKIISNEFGQHNRADNIVSQMMQAFAGAGLEYCFIYDGESDPATAGQSSVYALHNTDNSLRTNGLAAKTFINNYYNV